MAEFTSLNGYQVKDTVARSIAKGRNQAVAFVDYATMIEALNGLEKDEYRAGQNIYIGVVGVPDLWVYGIEDIVHNFEYVSDEDIVEMLKNNTTIQVGYYKLAMLEGQKVDLTTYDQHLLKHDDDITGLDKKIDDSVNEINVSLTAENSQTFQFAYDSESGKYGYKAKVEGADTFFPFKSNDFNMDYIGYTGGSDYTTALTFKNLEIGEAYIFAVSQCSLSNITIESASGLDIKSKYQSTIGISSSGSPGMLYGIATDTNVTINFASHIGGIVAIAFKIS